MVSGDIADADGPMDAVPGPGRDACDAHAALDVEAVLSDTSVVIPSRDEENYTSKSVPDWLEVVVRTDDGRSVARNRGVEEATGEWIVLADDDITFPTTLTAMLVDSMHTCHLVGLEDFWPMDTLLTRYMVFHRSLWDAVGGFDESREHGEDSDFVYRCADAGAKIRPLPRNIVPHHDADTEFSALEHVEWLWYLLRRHPVRMAPKAALLGFQKLGLVEPPVTDYPDGWSSQLIQPSGEGDER
ncbi:glycosyltransferase family 2 protein [Halogeometricum borinquense]|uniref:glycosyltransferase family 2 protein n=1 Tax=Halogeometricum borinquense TaxID=60847 RepID=UPI00341A17BA